MRIRLHFLQRLLGLAEAKMTNSIEFKFDKAKAAEAILYLANRLENASYHSIAKLLYFADKLHLERYGRFITGDNYVAMEYGPVPSHAYNMMQHPRIYRAPFSVDRKHDIPFIIPNRDADIDELSQSDINCLDEVIAKYGDKTFNAKTNASHDAAWQTAWEARGNKNSSPMSVESIVKSFSNYEALLTHLQDPFPDD